MTFNRAINFPGGFTLIELLLSIVIFAVVLSAINGVFYGAVRLRNKTTRLVEQALPTEYAVSVLRRDLAGIVTPGGLLSGSLRTGVSTMATSGTSQDAGFEFYSNTGRLDPVLPWGEVQKISYVLRDPTNRLTALGKDLYRMASRNLLATAQDIPEESWIMGGVQAIDFSFYDGSQWRNSWDSTSETTVLPQGIRVQISTYTEDAESGSAAGGRAMGTVSAYPIQIVVPVLVTTNLTQTTTTGGSQ